MRHLEEEKLHQYFDGELDPDEAAEVRELLAESTEARAKLGELERLRELFAIGGADLSAELASDELFARVRTEITAGENGAARSGRESASAPRLHVLDGGGASARPARPEGWKIAAAAGMVLAVAAAVLLVVSSSPDAPETAATELNRPTVEIGESAIVRIEDAPQGSEVEEVDFGANVGTVFEVRGEAGEPIAVVWINDDAPQVTR